ncbi:MAG: glycosyltransferase [Pseudomonas sp.]
MIILVGSKIDQSTIQASLGKPEYSYFFLMQEFVPVLERIGRVIVVNDAAEIDSCYLRHAALGEQVVFLSFSPPQQTLLGLQCPTIPVFAWEFDNLPDEAWHGDARNDWRHVFERTQGAITLSQEAAAAVRQAMGEAYPILVIPAPVWDRFASCFPEGGWLPDLAERRLSFTGHVIDSPLLGLSADGLVRKPEPVSTTGPKAVARTLTWHERGLTSLALARGWWQEVATVFAPPPVREGSEIAEPVMAKALPVACETVLQGVMYTTVLNPGDHRKNWIDMVSAFCWAFKTVSDATLVIKMTHHDLESYRIHLLTLLSRLAPFQCRVIVIHGFLEEREYFQLCQQSTYYVNTSVCEGLCLPLMEFMSAGKPAIAPLHTAMLDYLHDDSAFVVGSAPQPASWPHDSSAKLKARLHRINWESVMNAYRESYRIAREQPQAYQQMSVNAHQRLQAFCALTHVEQLLRPFLMAHAGDGVIPAPQVTEHSAP